jgi:hypothetical protein
MPGSISKTGGLSATATPSKNLRGIDGAVGAGELQWDVKLPEAEPDSHYSLCVQPNWLTAIAVTEKRQDGFHVKFAEAAPADATIDWQLIR